MFPTHSKPTERPIDTLEFEFTDLTSARKALEELPPGVAEAPTLVPGYWKKHRRTMRATDLALTGSTIDWLLRLPPSVRPHTLCELFPRIANSIAAVWYDPVELAAAFDGLLMDRRGGRRGFPPKVREEIEVLHAVWRTSKSG